MSTQEIITSLERQALDRWAIGDVLGYFMHCADDMTYSDDIGAQSGLIGIDTIKVYATNLTGQIPSHNYEMVGIHVQDYGDAAILMYHYLPTSLEGVPLTPWRASVVWMKRENRWNAVHAHWTMEGKT